MAYYQISSSTSGADLGVFEGDTPEQAHDAMAREAGYADAAEAAQVTGDDGSHLRIERLDPGQGLLAAAVQASGMSGREFARFVCDVNERTTRGWKDGTRAAALERGTARQLLRAIVAYPPIVDAIRLDRGAQSYQIHRSGTQAEGGEDYGVWEAVTPEEALFACIDSAFPDSVDRVRKLSAHEDYGHARVNPHNPVWAGAPHDREHYYYLTNTRTGAFVGVYTVESDTGED